ncbi:hypothetical protein [Roseivirga thermotolerans]|uniref:hypothetical protein n=1 Tax=Roseivirga thermotolerans TaxID=1758176 RepID=UPI00273D61D4|nr:hypothetical protein [Roseivirga thermotolerans]
MANKYRLEGEAPRFSFRGMGKIVVELLIIVVGIYLAFALDKYGERKEQKALEKKYLQELMEEAMTNLEELRADQQTRKHQLVLFGKLLETANRQVAEDTLRMAIKELLINRIFSPSDVVYQDLTSSGNLRLIESDTIRKTIIRYKGRLARAPITENVERRLIEDKLEPYLLQKQVLSLLEPMEDMDEINISEQQVDRIIRVLLNDRQFLDLVYLRYNRLKHTIYFENPVQRSLEILISLLKEEIRAKT